MYNVADYIVRCIKSILNNTYTNIKVFCIDDGSKDESAEIVKKIAKNDSRVFLISQENKGVSAARNRGIEIAFENDCDVIGFVDSDDWIHPQYIERLLSGIIKGYDISICNFERTKVFSNDYVAFSNNNNNDDDIFEYDLEQIESNIIAKKIVWGRLYRTTAIDNVRFLIDLNISEDELFNISVIISHSNPKICWINEKLYFYYDRSASLVHSIEGKNLLLFCKGCIYLLSRTLSEKQISFLINIIFPNLFCTRYYSKFDTDFLEIDKICKYLLNETWKTVSEKKIKINLKRKFIYMLFSHFPSLYRLYRIATDRTLLNWEKAQREKNKNSVLN